MDKIQTRVDLKTWLGGKPREIAESVGLRTVLRFTYCLGHLFDHEIAGADELTLSSFRALVLSEYLTWNKGVSVEVADARARLVASVAASESLLVATAPGVRCFKFVNASLAILDATISDRFTDAVNASINAINHVQIAETQFADPPSPPRKEYDQIWDEITADCVAIEDGKNIRNIDLYHASSYSRNSIYPWNFFDRTLSELDKNWEVWLNWFDDRMYGRVTNPSFEHALLSLSNEAWGQGSKYANALLASRKLEFEERTVPEGQELAYSVFEELQNQIHGRRYPFAPENFDKVAKGAHSELRRQLILYAELLENRGWTIQSRDQFIAISRRWSVLLVQI